MKLRTDALFPIAVLALLAVMTFWLERFTRAEEPRPDGKSRHDPDFIVERLTAYKYSETGELQYALVADKMVHYPDDESTDVFKPKLSYHSKPRVAHLTAERARISADGKVIVLMDGVSVWQEASGENPELRMTTPELTVIPEEEFAFTTAAVRIVQGRSVVTGIGLEMNNKLATATLKSRVRAFIEHVK